MEILERLINCEVNSPSAFAGVELRPYGKFFYNLSTPHCQDSNHGVFFDLRGPLEPAVEELILFYRLHGLIPRLYPSFQEGERRLLLPLLSRSGFDIQYSAHRLYVHQEPSRLRPGAAVKIRRAAALDSRLGALLQAEGEDAASLQALRQQLQGEGCHLLAGYLGEEPVCLALLKFLDGFCRLEDVITRREYRGRGFGSALIHAVVNYCRRAAPGSILYLWASNPAAVRIYRRAGFKEMDIDSPWSAAYFPRSRKK